MMARAFIALYLTGFSLLIGCKSGSKRADTGPLLDVSQLWAKKYLDELTNNK